ncbi:MAG TPA: tannase/feruloyl esterase family alpha/beta hydrolase, partial [Myxococcaceae bacterium]|nr:tannase/feruloyl esterase family alpha/beta hydrolase [Myxococcaceae bacterium]
MNRTSLIAASVFAASLVPARAWADLTADLCGKVSSRGGTITSEGVKTSFHIDTVEGRTTPVPHCFIHGTVAEDSAFLVQLPANWNGKYVLQMGGGVGGSEVAGNAFLLLQGYAHASSNQGRPAPVFEQADNWQELHLIRNHQLSQFVKGLIAQRYGSGPSRSYLYGSSGGAWRSLSQMERYPEAYDGAGIRNPVVDPRHIIFSRSVVELYQPVIEAKMAAI